MCRRVRALKIASARWKIMAQSARNLGTLTSRAKEVDLTWEPGSRDKKFTSLSPFNWEALSQVLCFLSLSSLHYTHTKLKMRFLSTEIVANNRNSRKRGFTAVQFVILLIRSVRKYKYHNIFFTTFLNETFPLLAWGIRWTTIEDKEKWSMNWVKLGCPP